MTENRDNRGRRTPRGEHGVSLDDVLTISQGDAITVRTARENSEQILTGRVTSTVADERVIEEYIEEYASAAVLTIEADVWWELVDDDLADRSHELEDRPPTRGHPSDPPEAPQSYSLSYRENGESD